MRLVIFNGSPRGKAGNSEFLGQWLSSGATQHPDVEVEMTYLVKVMEHDTYVQKLAKADTAVIAFPLYTDCMPGIVMAFFEKLEPLRHKLSHLKLGFVVHSGFPEACQSRAVEKYLVWLAKELGAQYSGTVIMGSSEGIRLSSPKELEGKKGLFISLGESLVTGGRFDEKLVKKAAGMERLSGAMLPLFKALSNLSFFQSLWIEQLKKNNAYHRRNDRPYQQ